MIVWIKKEAVNANTDQRAVVERVVGESLSVRLLGTDERVSVKAKYVTGIEINEQLTIRFKYTGHITSGH